MASPPFDRSLSYQVETVRSYPGLVRTLGLVASATELVTVAKLADQLGLSRSPVDKDLRALWHRDLVGRIGPRPYGYALTAFGERVWTKLGEGSETSQ